MAIGVSFLPGQGQSAAGGASTDPQEAVSQAIKILSLRLPRVQGAGAIAPAALLNAPGAAGVSGSGMNLDRLVQMILQGVLPQSAASMAAPAAMSGGIPPSLAQFFAQASPSGAPAVAGPGASTSPTPGMAGPSPSPWTPRIIPGIQDTASMPPPVVTGPPIAPLVQATPSQPQQGGGAGLDALFNSRRPRVV